MSRFRISFDDFSKLFDQLGRINLLPPAVEMREAGEICRKHCRRSAENAVTSDPKREGNF